MIYGLYLSASGVLTNSYRQDVIANNIANAETVGFRRDLALFQERLTEAQAGRFRGGITNDLLEPLGGGVFAAPTLIDARQGELERTGNNLDIAIEGSGYFLVDDSGTQRLTRNGGLMIDRAGNLILAHSGQKILDDRRKPIVLNGALSSQTEIADDGQITQAGQPAGRIGVFDVPDPVQLTKRGRMLLDHPSVATLPAAKSSLIHGGSLERANLEPTTELTILMDAQRQLEANANMIRYQDQTLGKLVNEVGKI